MTVIELVCEMGTKNLQKPVYFKFNGMHIPVQEVKLETFAGVDTVVLSYFGTVDPSPSDSIEEET